MSPQLNTILAVQTKLFKGQNYLQGWLTKLIGYIYFMGLTTFVRILNVAVLFEGKEKNHETKGGEMTDIQLDSREGMKNIEFGTKHICQETFNYTSPIQQPPWPTSSVA